MIRIHRLVGIITVSIFLLTGIYMKLNFPELYKHNEAIRFLFRANHIYILLAGLLNIGIGSYFNLNSKKWKRNLQFTGSFFLFIAPLLLITAFFVEPQTASSERPLTFYGILALALGTVCQIPTWNKPEPNKGP